MRDPKTHAKVMSIRNSAVLEAHSRAMREGWGWEQVRLLRLLGRIQELYNPEVGRCGWVYDPHANPPHWRHGTEIIPDTEEEA